MQEGAAGEGGWDERMWAKHAVAGIGARAGAMRVLMSRSWSVHIFWLTVPSIGTMSARTSAVIAALFSSTPSFCLICVSFRSSAQASLV